MAKKTPITVTPSMFAGGNKVCRKCGSAVNARVKHCTSCGSDRFFNNYNEYHITTLKYCRKCGKVNDRGYTCCPDCGSSHFVSYDESTTSKKLRKAFKIGGILIDILIVLGLLIFGIWAHIDTDGATWTGLLIFTTVYCGIVIPVALWFYSAAKDDDEAMGLLLAILGVLDFFSIVAFIPLICIKSVAIWGGIISFACLLTNFISALPCIIDTIKSLIKSGRWDDNIILYGIGITISAIIFIIGIVVLTNYGWGLYF